MKLERQGSSRSNGGDPRVGRSMEEGSRHRDPRSSPKKRKSVEESEYGEGVGEVDDVKRLKSL